MKAVMTAGAAEMAVRARYGEAVPLVVKRELNALIDAHRAFESQAEILGVILNDPGSDVEGGERN